MATPVLTTARTVKSRAGSSLFNSWTPVEHPKAGPHGALGVVAMRDRGAEHGHDRVADELLHHAAERFDLGLHPGVIWNQQGPNVFGVGLVRARSEVDQVDEQHRDDLALFDGRLDGQCRATGRTEPRPLGILLPTSRTPGHEEQSTFGASLAGRTLASAERDRWASSRVPDGERVDEVWATGANPAHSSVAVFTTDFDRCAVSRPCP